MLFRRSKMFKKNLSLLIIIIILLSSVQIGVIAENNSLQETQDITILSQTTRTGPLAQITYTTDYQIPADGNTYNITLTIKNTQNTRDTFYIYPVHWDPDRIRSGQTVPGGLVKYYYGREYGKSNRNYVIEESPGYEINESGGYNWDNIAGVTLNAGSSTNVNYKTKNNGSSDTIQVVFFVYTTNDISNLDTYANVAASTGEINIKPVEKYTLKVYKNPTNSDGFFKINGSKKTSSSFTQTYFSGENVRIQAYDGDDYEFDDFSGSLNSSNDDIDITMSGNKNIYVNFDEKKYTMGARLNGDGWYKVTRYELYNSSNSHLKTKHTSSTTYTFTDLSKGSYYIKAFHDDVYLGKTTTKKYPGASSGPYDISVSKEKVDFYIYKSNQTTKIKGAKIKIFDRYDNEIASRVDGQNNSLDGIIELHLPIDYNYTVKTYENENSNVIISTDSVNVYNVFGSIKKDIITNVAAKGNFNISVKYAYRDGSGQVAEYQLTDKIKIYTVNNGQKTLFKEKDISHIPCVISDIPSGNYEIYAYYKEIFLGTKSLNYTAIDGEKKDIDISIELPHLTVKPLRPDGNSIIPQSVVEIYNTKGTLIDSKEVSTIEEIKGMAVFALPLSLDSNNKYIIKVKEHNKLIFESGQYNHQYDVMSDAPYLAVQNKDYIYITSNHSGQVYNYDNTVNIKWLYANNIGSNVIIKLYKGTTEKISFGSQPNTGSYNFIITENIVGLHIPEGDDYKIVISSLDGSVKGESGVFEIKDIFGKREITVNVKESNGAVSKEVNALILVEINKETGDYIEEVARVQNWSKFVDIPYTFSNIDSQKKYYIEAYVNDMHVPGNSFILTDDKTVLINVPPRKKLTIEVFNDDLGKKYADATVKIYSHQGECIWREGSTDNQGIYEAWLLETILDNEYYKIVVTDQEDKVLISTIDYVKLNFDKTIPIHYSSNAVKPKMNVYFQVFPNIRKVGSELIFDGSTSKSPTSSIATYNWDFGDGTSGSGKIVKHIYSDVGNYEVRLTVTDKNGNSDYFSTHLPVFDKNMYGDKKIFISPSGYLKTAPGQSLRFKIDAKYDDSTPISGEGIAVSDGITGFNDIIYTNINGQIYYDIKIPNDKQNGKYYIVFEIKGYDSSKVCIDIDKDSAGFLSGYVFDNKHDPVSNVQVSFANKSVKTDTEGRYELSDIPGSNGNLIVSKAGYYTKTIPIVFDSVSEYIEITIASEGTDSIPLIREVKTECFNSGDGLPLYVLEGHSLPLNFETSVDWKGFTPKSIHYTFGESKLSTSADDSISFDVGKYINIGGQQISVIAESSEGIKSKPLKLEIYIIKVPSYIDITKFKPHILLGKLIYSGEIALTIKIKETKTDPFPEAFSFLAGEAIECSLSKMHCNAIFDANIAEFKIGMGYNFDTKEKLSLAYFKLEQELSEGIKIIQKLIWMAIKNFSVKKIRFLRLLTNQKAKY
jgi:hypothetical protein